MLLVPYITFFYKKEGLQPALKPIYHVVSYCAIHLALRFSTTQSTSRSAALFTSHSIPQIAELSPKYSPSWVCPIGLQHSHVTCLESLSFFASDFCYNIIVGLVELLQSLCYLLFLAAHFLQQFLCHMFCNLLYQHCLPLSKLLKLLIYYLRQLEGLILPRLSSLR